MTSAFFASHILSGLFGQSNQLFASSSQGMDLLQGIFEFLAIPVVKSASAFGLVLGSIVLVGLSSARTLSVLGLPCIASATISVALALVVTPAFLYFGTIYLDQHYGMTGLRSAVLLPLVLIGGAIVAPVAIVYKDIPEGWIVQAGFLWAGFLFLMATLYLSKICKTRKAERLRND